MEVIPIPPAFPIPQAFKLPSSPLSQPKFSLPPWIEPSRPVDGIKELIPQFIPPSVELPKDYQDSKEKTEDESDKAEEQDEKDLDQTNDGLPAAIPPPQLNIPLPAYLPQKQQVEKQSEYENSVVIPGIEYELPLPSNEVMVTAGVTASIAAVVSVSGTLAAKSIFDYLLKLIKPALKILVNKIAKARGKPNATWARQRLLKRRNKLDKTD